MPQSISVASASNPSSSHSFQKQKIEPRKTILEKGRDPINNKKFPALTFPAQIHPRQKKFQPGVDISALSKSITTSNYEHETFLKAGIKIAEPAFRGRGGALSLPLERTASVAPAGADQVKSEQCLPKVPEEVIRKEDLKIPWRR